MGPAPPLSNIGSPFDGDDIPTALDTETLAGREVMLEGFDNVLNSKDNMPIELADGRRFLKVDQTANLRAGLKVSKVREHSFEYRSLDNGLYDKYWRCEKAHHTGEERTG